VSYVGDGCVSRHEGPAVQQLKIMNEMSTRGLTEASMVAAGWAAITALFVFVPLHSPRSPDPWWGVETLVVTAVTGLVAALVVVDAVRVRGGGAAKVARIHLLGLGLGGIAWLCGGFVDLLIYFLGLHSNCSGTSGLGSFECVNRPGPVLDLLGVVSATAATPVLIALIAGGRRSRVAAWLSAALVVAMYLLAAWLWQPHIGFGVPDRPFVALV
jgi:hypothetical protein